MTGMCLAFRQFFGNKIKIGGMKMKNDYKAENVVKFVDDFIKQEEQFDSVFFDRLSCMFTTAGLWDDVKANCDKDFTNQDYYKFYDWMVKWIV